jgi:hypothetical protein
MASRSARVQALADAVADYTSKEKLRIEKEVEVLEKILSGRTGGAGVQKSSTAVVEAVAKNDLKSFLEGA